MGRMRRWSSMRLPACRLQPEAGYDARVVEAASYDSRAAAKGAGHTVQEMKEAGLAWWRCEMAVSRARR